MERRISSKDSSLAPQAWSMLNDRRFATSHWRGLRRKPKDWLFPGGRWHTANHPITTKVVWDACQKAAQRAGIHKKIHPHTLRHYSECRTMPSDKGSDGAQARI
jgi:site-specific recombinase XerD